MPVPSLTIEDLRLLASTAIPEGELRSIASALDAKFAILGWSRSQRAQFLAQIAHESGGFYYREELASGEDYEGRDDLGNVEVGDGVRYKGRGFIQLTGRANYQAAGKALGLDLEARPELASADPYAVDLAFWFWQENGLSLVGADYDSEVDKCDRITLRVNGGHNGLDDRQHLLQVALGIYGMAS